MSSLTSDVSTPSTRDTSHLEDSGHDGEGPGALPDALPALGPAETARPDAVAARFALEYLEARTGETPVVFAERLRPLVTDRLRARVRALTGGGGVHTESRVRLAGSPRALNDNRWLVSVELYPDTNSNPDGGGIYVLVAVTVVEQTGKSWRVDDFELK